MVVRLEQEMRSLGLNCALIALCRRIRQVVAYFIGDRNGASYRAFWERIPASYKRGFTVSDYWKTCRQVIRTGRHFSVGKESGETNHVDRWNNTLRQRIGRFVRKTLSFSKSDEMHEL
ncbi:MAG: IS1 family transposase, partial [Hymenobacteraceae bacterium]|nr:IS1 family transposase [Hymenobacteraceae bacterium]